MPLLQTSESYFALYKNGYVRFDLTGIIFTAYEIWK
jgi:hypothetical protein